MKKTLLLLFAALLGGVNVVNAEEVVLLNEPTTLDSWGATSTFTATSAQVAVGDFVKIVVDEIPTGSQLVFKKSDYSDICVGNGQLASITYYQVTSDIYEALTGSGIIFQGDGGVIISKISIVPASDFDVITIYDGNETISTSWGSVAVPGGNFNAAQEGDILVVNTTSETSGNENFLFKKNGYEDALSTYSLTKPWCTSLTSDVIEGYYNNSNHIQSGTAGITVNSVKIYRLKENLPIGEKTLEPEEALPTAFGNWEKSVKISADQFANVSVGDEIRIALSNADKSTSYNAQVYVKTMSDGYPLLKPIGEDGGYNVPYIPEIVFTISSESIASQLKTTGLVLQGQNVTIENVTLYYSTISVTFPADKTLISYSPSAGIKLDVTDVDGLKAYIVSDVTKTAVNLSETKGVIGDGTGYILEGTAGATYNLPVVASAPSYVGLNKLYGSGDTPSSVEANTKYVLYNGKFCLFTGTEIPAHKAYLDASEVPDASANELTLNFGDDDATAIKNIKVGTEDNIYYDLQGRRVLYPTKGLYIVNGKKVIVK